LYLSRKRLESVAIAGDSPVCGKGRLTIRYLSRTRHVKASLNLRGPSRKAKYSLATDSAPVARAKGGKNPDKGRIVNLKPHAYKRSEPYGASQGDGVPFA
jgi:hypothetical protein